MPTKIPWVVNPDGSPGETWNPIVGCTAISPGCLNCYPARQASTRLAHLPDYKGLAKDGKWTAGPRFLPGRLDEPLHRRKPTGYFVCDMGDLFHEGVADEQIAAVFGVMAACPQHRFYVLTKRAARMRLIGSTQFRCMVRDRLNKILERQRKPYRWPEDEVPGPPHLWFLPNVWLGVTVEDQCAAGNRIADLLAPTAAVRFLSCEPLLAPVALPEAAMMNCRECGNAGSAHLEVGYDAYATSLCRKACVKRGEGPFVDWVIVGAESGPHARPCALDWVRSIVRQCADAGVPCFVKQIHLDSDPRRLSRDPAEWPAWARVRQFPEAP